MASSAQVYHREGQVLVNALHPYGFQVSEYATTQELVSG